MRQVQWRDRGGSSPCSPVAFGRSLPAHPAAAAAWSDRPVSRSSMHCSVCRAGGTPTMIPASRAARAAAARLRHTRWPSMNRWVGREVAGMGSGQGLAAVAHRCCSVALHIAACCKIMLTTDCRGLLLTQAGATYCCLPPTRPPAGARERQRCLCAAALRRSGDALHPRHRAVLHRCCTMVQPSCGLPGKGLVRAGAG